MAEVIVDGKRATYTTGGKTWTPGQPAVAMVHGVGGTHAVWVLQSRALAHHGYNVLAVNLPGHWHSEDQPSIASIADFADWLARLLDALRVERAAIVGHSMGGAIAVELAARHSERAAALLLLGTGATLPVNDALLNDSRDAPPRARQFMTSFGHARATQLGGAPTPGSWLLGSDHALLDSESAPALYRDFKACAEWEGAASAAIVACPTLVLTGAADRMTPPALGRKLAAAVPGAEFQEIPAGGHFFMAETPRPVLKAMSAFLNRVLPPGPQEKSA